MSTRSRSAVVLATLLVASLLPAHAQRHASGPVEMALVDRDAGHELPQYRHRGQTWVPGTPGHRYAVRLTNRSPGRVLVVLSVDGVNAVSGQTADPHQGGYVLEPWQTTEVAGWRKSMRDVARFHFSDSAHSYAARTGRPANVGVVGIAVFEEARRPTPPRVHQRIGAAQDAAAPTAEAAAPAMAGARAQSIGTGHGEREYAPVAHTGFHRASTHPVQLVQLRYADERSLVARGILPPDAYSRHRGEPDAFPGSFVPDPPRGW
jgi:hypothetical protein